VLNRLVKRIEVIDVMMYLTMNTNVDEQIIANRDLHEVVVAVGSLFLSILDNFPGSDVLFLVRLGKMMNSVLLVLGVKSMNGGLTDFFALAQFLNVVCRVTDGTHFIVGDTGHDEKTEIERGVDGVS